MHVMRRLLGYLRPYRTRVALGVFCLLATSGFSLLVPWLIQSAIDIGLNGDLARLSAEEAISSGPMRWLLNLRLERGQTAFMAFLGGSMVLLGILRSVFGFGQRYLSEWTSHRIAYDLRNVLYDHIQQLPFAYHDQTQTGQLISRVSSDVESIQRFAGFGLADVINTIILLVGILVILLSNSVTLTIVALLPLPILGLITVRFARVIRPQFLGIQAQMARLSEILQENLVGIQVVKAFTREPHEIEKFGSANRDLYERRVRLVRQWSINFPLMSFTISVSTALILLFGGLAVADGRLTVGTVVAFNSYVVMLGMPIQRMGWIINMAAMAVAAGERIFEVLDTEPAIRNRPDARRLATIKGEVRFEDVAFRYDEPQALRDVNCGDNGRGLEEGYQLPSYQEARRIEWARQKATQLPLILENIDLEAKPNQVIALVGPTGAGKSTVINLIPRFYEAICGRVTIDGLDVRELELQSLRRQTGIVLQDPLLFSTSVRENIAYGRPEAPQEAVTAAARAARAHRFIMELPDAYDTLVGERGVTLSGGQRQRIAIARALLMDPRILILDDSTSSVDAETEHLIQQALAELMQGRTTFVIAQRLTTVKKADLILVLEDGRIVERGTHDELVQMDGAYCKIYRLQLQDRERLLAELRFLGGQRQRKEDRIRLGDPGGQIG
jgi:ATP-binding cassette subfamily B multidrug efflux pump